MAAVKRSQRASGRPPGKGFRAAGNQLGRTVAAAKRQRKEAASTAALRKKREGT